MSHKEFVLAYENGNIGCSVSTWTTGWLFIGGKIRQKKLSGRLFFWSVSFPVVMTGSGFGFLNFRFFWAILETVVTLLLWTFAFFYWVTDMQIGEAVVSGASQGPKGAQEVSLRRFARWRTANG